MRTMPFGVCLCVSFVCVLCAGRPQSRSAHGPGSRYVNGATHRTITHQLARPQTKTPRDDPACRVWPRLLLGQDKTLVGIIDPAERSSFYAPSLFTLH